MDPSNLDENTMNNIKNMVDNGNLSDALSHISPEMIENFQKMLNNNTENQPNQTSSNQANTTTNNSNNSNNSTQTNTNNTGNNNFDFSKIDMNTMMKIGSMLNNMNNKDDPRANLIYSLKPYLRDSKKGKVDQYANLLNMTKMADLFKNNNPTEKPHD